MKQAALSLQLYDSVEEPLKLVDPPYLTEDADAENRYVLALDLDETLVHYFEVIKTEPTIYLDRD